MNQLVTKEHVLYPRELFALSKATILGIVSVRPSKARDVKAIEWLLENFNEKKEIIEDVSNYLNCMEADPGYKMMTVCVEDDTVIGKTSSETLYAYKLLQTNMENILFLSSPVSFSKFPYLLVFKDECHGCNVNSPTHGASWITLNELKHSAIGIC